MMEKLIERSYMAIRRRGLITVDTDTFDFCKKMSEELEEINTAVSMENYIEECTDLMTVCAMSLVHFGFDPVKEFEKVVIKNEKRANETANQNNPI